MSVTEQRAGKFDFSTPIIRDPPAIKSDSGYHRQSMAEDDSERSSSAMRGAIRRILLAGGFFEKWNDEKGNIDLPPDRAWLRYSETRRGHLTGGV